jgi:ferredoxin
MTMHATNAATDSGTASGAGARLRLDPTRCSGHGLCAELLGEHIALDEWGYPIIADRAIPAQLLPDARRAVTDCPALALRLDIAAREGAARL